MHQVLGGCSNCPASRAKGRCLGPLAGKSERCPPRVRIRVLVICFLLLYTESWVPPALASATLSSQHPTPMLQERPCNDSSLVTWQIWSWLPESTGCRPLAGEEGTGGWGCRSWSMVSLIPWDPCACGMLRGRVWVEVPPPCQRLGGAYAQTALAGPRGTQSEHCGMLSWEPKVRKTIPHVHLGVSPQPSRLQPSVWTEKYTYLPTQTPSLPFLPGGQQWALEISLGPSAYWDLANSSLDLGGQIVSLG